MCSGSFVAEVVIGGMDSREGEDCVVRVTDDDSAAVVSGMDSVMAGDVASKVASAGVASGVASVVKSFRIGSGQKRKKNRRLEALGENANDENVAMS
ncbi:hypothetical protein L6452_14028 [Arctium lappa]|uniref:Uncharacterized protein n=1 Tax=Arctium lappa TaxID=4217 RepID=A0ACB9CJU6_ARCLA|nr:hypothetical protein L6452_14028 [Arctium lappa]